MEKKKVVVAFSGGPEGVNAGPGLMFETLPKVFMSMPGGNIVGIVFFVCAIFIPKAYNYPDEVRDTATKLMQICAIVMPIDAFAHATYFTLRSGGKTLITFVFDSGFMWTCMIPVAFVLSRFTDLPILPLYAICQCPELVKCFLGAYMLKKGSWIQNLTV